MDLTKKTVLAHRGFFNSSSFSTHKENSVDVCKISGNMDHIDVIELDVRKSSDGILYCYHGNTFEYFFSLRFARTFSSLQTCYGAQTLQDILSVIDTKKTILLDIKDTSITREDILESFSKLQFKEVILANKSPAFLDTFVELPPNFFKMLNGNIFCSFYNLETLKQKNFKYFEVVFPFQINQKAIEQVRKAGLEFRCSSLFFFSQNHYFSTIKRYDLDLVSTDFLD